MAEKQKGFFKKIFTPSQSRDIGSSSNGLTASLLSALGIGDSGVSVSSETALKFSAVWLARRILSQLPASLPVEVYEDSGLTRKPIDHPVKQILMKPNEMMTGFTWHELMNDWLHGWGNGTAVVRWSHGKPASLLPVHPSSVTPKVKDGRLYYKVADKDMDINETLFSRELVHYKLFTPSGFWGRDPISIAKDNIGLGLAAEQFGAKFFRKGGNIKGVIETDNHLDDKSFKSFKERWDANYEGTQSDHSTPILEYGLKYKALGIPPDAAQFLETRQFSIQDISRWFNLPPHMLFDLTRATFSNIEHQDLQFVKYSLRPIIRMQEMELEDKLLLPEEKGRIRIRFNLDGMLRGDLASVTSHIREMVVTGILSPDEGRGLLNRNPRPDGTGSTFYTPVNIVGKEDNNNNDE